MPLMLDGTHEFPHGEAFSVRRGVADGLQDSREREACIPDTHIRAYEMGRDSGMEWRRCICGDVSRGIVEEIDRDQREPAPAHPQPASTEYRLGRMFGECLTEKIAEAETP